VHRVRSLHGVLPRLDDRQDPLAEALAHRLVQADAAPSVQERVAFFAGFAPVFGELGGEPRFVAAVARQLAVLETRGVLGALAVFDTTASG